MHTVYDPQADHPRRITITSSTVNDVEVGREEPIEAGATYVIDKSYCDYDWWSRIHQAGASFVTRAKKNARYEIIRQRCVKEAERQGDGFTILADADVRLGAVVHGVDREAAQVAIVDANHARTGLQRPRCLISIGHLTVVGLARPGLVVVGPGEHAGGACPVPPSRHRLGQRHEYLIDPDPVPDRPEVREGTGVMGIRRGRIHGEQDVPAKLSVPPDRIAAAA